MSNYPGGWFGASWYAPVCDETRHRPTPVDAPCAVCAKCINAGDQGVLIPFTSEPVTLLAYHLDCFLGSILPKARGWNDVR